MPVLMVSRVEFNSSRGYYVDIQELYEKFPHIQLDKDIEFYIIEVKDDNGKLVKRFKPFKKIISKVSGFYQHHSGYRKCLFFTEDEATYINIGKDYKVTFIIQKYDNKPFLPFELKAINDDAQEILESLRKIEYDLILLLLSSEQPILDKSIGYLWDAYFRLEENDVEGARTMLRNSLDVLKKELLPRLSITEKFEESENFPDLLDKLITTIQRFLHYGGPHPGPAPRTTTEMILSLIIELIKYFAKCIESNLISIKQDTNEARG